MAAHDRLKEFASGRFPFTFREASDGGVFSVECMGLNLALTSQQDDRYFPFFWITAPTGCWGGDKSDIVEITSLLLASYLSLSGHLSCEFLDEGHAVVHGELGRRLLVPRQPTGIYFEPTPESLGKLLFDLGVFLFELHQDLPHYCPANHPNDGWTTEEAHPQIVSFAQKLRAVPALQQPDIDHYISLRIEPDHAYYRLPEQEIALIRSPDAVNFILNQWPIAYQRMQGVEGDIYRVDDLMCHIPHEVERRGRQLIATLEDLDASDVSLIAFENCFAAIGLAEFIALLPGVGGRAAFELERERIFERWQRESEMLFPASSYTWSSRLEPQRFEDLILDLLRADGGRVTEAYSTGPSNDRDRGIDLVAQMMVATGRPSLDDSPHLQRVKIVVQCKAYSKTVGIDDVKNIRDTIEDAGAQGFLLATPARLSSPLIERLIHIRERSGHITEWWDRHEIEQRLRRNPHIARRYTDLFTFSTHIA